MARRPPALYAALLALSAAPAAAQQSPQFRADVSQTGDTPFTGTMYFAGPRMRIEGTSDGEPMTMIIDRTAGRVLMLMAEERMYMVMDLGSMPFTAPGADTMDPANPCSSGELTACENLGTESVNGHTTRNWAYTRDGERETVWIATDLGFPVRVEDADGNITDLTNVVMGTQPAALFEPPGDYTLMEMPGFGRRGGFPGGAAARGAAPSGRGQPEGRGQVPTGRDAPPGDVGGVDPTAAAQLTAQLQAMGLPPDQIAMAIAGLGAAGTVTNSGPWEAIEAWVVDIVVTASGTETRSIDRGTETETYSARYTGSVPITYGTPAVGASAGPAWQLVQGLGTPAGQAQPLVGSGTHEYHREVVVQPGRCDLAEAGDGFRTVTEARASGELRETDHNSMTMMTTQARFEISGDLSTYSLFAGAPVQGTETTTTTQTYMNACPGSPQPTTETSTRESALVPQFNVTGQPLPGAPGTFSGTAVLPLRFEIGGFSGELEANVEWTLRPIS